MPWRCKRFHTCAALQRATRWRRLRLAVYLLTIASCSLPLPAFAQVLPLYSDSGILGGSDIFTWGVAATWDGDYEGIIPPEGLKCFRTDTTGSFAGWGVFKAGTDLAAYTNGHLRFWLKSDALMKLEVEDQFAVKRSVFLESTGGAWQFFSVPTVAFSGVNFANMNGLFMMTLVGSGTFYVDRVSWEPPDPPGVPDPDAVNLLDHPFTSYAGGSQDVLATQVQIMDNGARFRMWGANSKAFTYPYTVRTNTYLEFDFRSAASQGVVSSIALEEDLTLSADRLFQIYGTTAWGLQDVHDYTGNDWKHYTIPIGQSYTGNMVHLVFLNNGGAGQTVVLEFRHIKIYDDTTSNVPPSVYAGFDTETVIALPATLSGTIVDDGKPTSTLLTQWSLQSGPGLVTFVDSNSVDTEASFSTPGAYTLRLTANDTERAGHDDVMVTVLTNYPPVVDAGTNITASFPYPISLDGTVTDDGLPYGSWSSQWSQVSGPGIVSFADSNAVDTIANVTVDGVYVLRLKASDGEHVAADDVTLTVIPGVSGTALENGTTVSTNFAVIGETNAYQFSASSGDVLKMRMARTGGSFFFSKMELIDPFGVIIATASSWDDAEMVIAITTPGPYRLRCSEGSNRVGSYGLAVLWLNEGVPLAPDAIELGTLENGATVSGNISIPADFDAATFHGTSGAVVNVRMALSSGTFFFSRLELWAPDGRLVAAGSSWDDADVVTTLPTNGIYTIVCEENSVSTGPYNLSLLRLDAGVPLSTNDTDLGPIQNGATLAGTISAHSYIDASTFTGTVGDVVTIRMARDRTYPFFFSVVRLYDTMGNLVGSASSWDDAELTATLPTSGTYTIVCKEDDGHVGNYGLSILWLTPGNPLSTSDSDVGPIQNGEVLTGTISHPSDLDASSFTGSLGDVVRIRMSRDPGAPFFLSSAALYAPNGALIESASSWQDAEFTVTLPADGTYTVVHKEEDMQTGPYSVSALWVTPGMPLSTNDADLPTLGNGEAILADISHPTDLDVSFFEGQLGDHISIRMCRQLAPFFSSVELIGPTGALIGAATSWDAATLLATLPTDGIYAILCKEDSGTMGEYGLSLLWIDPDAPLSTNDTDVGLMTNGSLRSGMITNNADMDAAHFYVTPGSVITARMDMANALLRANMGLYDTNGQHVAGASSWDVAELSATLTNGGMYMLVATEGSLQYGGYQLALESSDSDVDDDGLPDAWELLFQPSVNVMDHDSDYDGDGFLDLHEFLAGTIPTNAASLLESFALRLPSGVAEIQWSSVTGRVYRILRTFDLAQPFTAIQTNVIATPPLNSYMDATTNGSELFYYRIRIE